MAMKAGDQDEDIVAEINVTPLVDVMLVLLIIFMVTSTYITKAAIEVELPKAASGGQTVESTLNIIITQEGQLLMNGKNTTPQEMASWIQNELKINKNLQAVISADRKVAYGQVVSILDLIKLNGIKNFALNIEKEVQTP
jgi:biopolymer transport protein ExbD